MVAKPGQVSRLQATRVHVNLAIIALVDVRTRVDS